VKPLRVPDASVIVNVVDGVPLAGETRTGTFTMPFIEAWIAQWSGYAAGPGARAPDGAQG